LPVLRFEAGETIFHQGDDVRGVHILESGQVDFLFSARNGSVKQLRMARLKQILGLSCLFTGRPHECTATARVACETSFIERDAFLSALAERPDGWTSVLRLLSSDVDAVYDDMRHLAARDSRHATA